MYARRIELQRWIFYTDLKVGIGYHANGKKIPSEFRDAQNIMKDSFVCAIIEINLDLHGSFPKNGKLFATYSSNKGGSRLCRIERNEI